MALSELDLNFVGRRRPQALGVLLLALGGAAAAVSLLDYRAVAAAIEAERLASRSAGRASAPPPVQRGTQDVRELRQDLLRANTVMRQMSVPWERMFAAVEQATGRDVALLALHPDVAAQQVRIAGQAKSIEHALAFVQRLAASNSLADPHLTGHNSTEDRDFPIAFTLAARWIEQP